MVLSQYEIEREANMARNAALLTSLGLTNDSKDLFPVQTKKPKKVTAPVKRKAKDAADEEERPKVARTDSDDAPTSGTRRSARNAGKTVDYKAEINRGLPEPVAARSMEPGNSGPVGAGSGKKIVKFGSIPGIEVGTWWYSREDCSNDSIHAPWVGGISGTQNKGCYSIALSGGYADDVDLGYAFTYTGSGGRDLKGTAKNPKNLRTAPQSSDQKFVKGNAALKKSCETRKPVRVIRGFKCPSKFAPSKGYRYDGLYMVEKAWMEKGLSPGGFLVCKFAFKRLDGQPPLPERDLEAEAASKALKTKDKTASDEDSEVETDNDSAVEDEEEDSAVKDEGVEEESAIDGKKTED